VLPLCIAVVAMVAVQWQEFHAGTLGITFHHPGTPGLRFDARAATCTPDDRSHVPVATESTVVVTRARATLPLIAASSGLERIDGAWRAQGPAPAPVSTIATHGWNALLAVDARTLGFDAELGQPVVRPQWRLVAVGPGECPAVLVGIATAMQGIWDSAAVVRVLADARLDR
jgi:hypothetical protein